jgi:hypothetical protein
VTSYQNTNVAAGSHTYYVTAYNSAGESVPSASVAVSRVTQNKHQTRLIQHILNGRH